MRSVLVFILIACFFYWLFGNGIVSFDGMKAQYHLNKAIAKINELDPAKTGKNQADGMENVDLEVSNICNDLRDLSQRALELRKKLLANVVESADRADYRPGRR